QPHRRAVVVRQLLSQERRCPVAAKQLSHRARRADTRNELVLIGSEHRFLRAPAPRYFSSQRQTLTWIKFKASLSGNNASALKGADNAYRNHRRGCLCFNCLYWVWLGAGVGGSPNERCGERLSELQQSS